MIVNMEQDAKGKVLDVMFSTFSLDKICSYGIIYLHKKVNSSGMTTICQYAYLR